MTRAERNVIDVGVGRRVRMTRISRNRSHFDVARYLGVTAEDYGELEEGRKRFSASQLQQLSQLFRVNLVIFFAEFGNPDSGQPHQSNVPVNFSANDNAAIRPAGLT